MSKITCREPVAVLSENENYPLHEHRSDHDPDTIRQMASPVQQN